VVDYRKHGRLLAAPEVEKFICISCGCLFPDSGWGADICPDCSNASVAADRARAQAYRAKRLAQVNETLRRHTEILQAIWAERSVMPGWYVSFPGWVLSIRSLRVTKALLENDVLPLLPMGIAD
jgi:hypothetical protein